MKSRRKIGILLFLAPLHLTNFPCARAEEEGGVSIIVNVDNPVSALTSDQIADYFLKRTRQWADGTAVRFFDRREDSPERVRFLERVVRKSPREIDLYWIGQKLFSGNSAPTQVPSDSMMVALVSRFKGAIGYVSSEFTPGKGVRKIGIGGGP